MEVQLKPEQEVQLSKIADQTGRSTEELAREAVDRYLAEEARFHTAVQEGIDAADRGELLAPSQVWERVERQLEARS
jgi:predicted transcriptional regulator